MGAGHSVTALYELIPAGRKIDVPSIDPLKYQQPTSLSAASTPAEAMTVKLRYQRPDEDVSTKLDVPVKNTIAKSAQLGFAAAIVEFGMLLRDSPFKGSSSYAEARALADRFKGEDPHGHRAEFIRLIGLAEQVSQVHMTSR
jgi:Ca-activated chloride channel family protein